MNISKIVSVVALLATLAAPGIASADKDEKCSVSTLNDVYALTASGFNVVSGVGQPKAIVELIDFNGDGTLTVPAATVSINGVISRSPPGGTGTYLVNPDCTGSVAFGATGGPTWDLFIGAKAAKLYMIQTAPGAPVFQGTAERISRD